MGDVISLQEYREQQPQPQQKEFLEEYNQLSDGNKWVLNGFMAVYLTKTVEFSKLYDLLRPLDKLRTRQEIKKLLQEQKAIGGK